MKKLLICLAASGMMFSSCQKEDQNDPLSSPSSSRPSSTVTPGTSSVSAVPTSFLKKSLVEEYVGTSYGLVPETNYDVNQICSAYPDRVYSIGMHYYDNMCTYQTKKVFTTLTGSVPAFPSGTVDRAAYNGNMFIDSKTFDNAIAANINKPADCGLAIESSINGQTANVKVHCGFRTIMTGQLKVTTYLVEDRVISNDPDFAQTNNFDNDPTSHFFHAGNPIPNYEFNGVIRSILSLPLGDDIDASALVAGGEFVRTYNIDLPRRLSSVGSYSIVTFISDAGTNEILNTQKVTLGTEKDWN